MDTVLICGGFLEEETAKKVLEKIKPDCIIGIDRGLEFCYRNQIYPQYILGDFDSVDKRILDFYENQKEIPVQRYKPEKDATDARIGLELALKLGSKRIFSGCYRRKAGSLYGKFAVFANTLKVWGKSLDY